MEIKDISSEFEFNSRFTISGVTLQEILDLSGTPAFIYDANTIARNYAYLRLNIPEEVDICYAMKANPNRAIVKLLTILGTGVEVASRGELLACESVGVNPNNIVFAGPGKTDEDITSAIESGIYSINAESSGELERISRVSQSLKKKANVSLRLNPGFKVEGATLHMGAASTQFGISPEGLEEAIQKAKSLPGINFRGIHIFSASNIMSQEGFLANLDNCFKLAGQVNQYHPVTMIDFGGGLGVPYAGEKPLALEGIGNRIGELIEQNPFIRKNKTRLILEPGRYLTAQSGVYVTQVVDVKKSRDLIYVLTDGGINNLLRPALIGTNHPIFNLSRKSNKTKQYQVAGPLCTTLDILGKNISLPSSTKPGDYLGVFCSGAYGFTESMPLFLSHDIPAEVLVFNGRPKIIRPRKHIESIIDEQIVPEELR